MARAQRLPLEDLAPYLLAVPIEPSAFSWPEIFGNDHPVQLEVGFGKGLFLLTSGQANPHINHVGIEIDRKYQLLAATRIAKHKLTNVRLAHGDARGIMRDHVASESLAGIHVYFPDPWWKTRHHKRRLFTPEFVDQCERVIQAGGRLTLATDVADYFAIMQQLVAKHPRLHALPPPEPGTPAHDLDYLTHFERKFRREGRAIYRAAYERSA